MSILASFTRATVPKRWFTHMYIIGLCAGGIALYLVLSKPQLYVSIPWLGTIVALSVKGKTVVVLLLFLLQCFRRWLECVYVSDFGSSRMHISGYLVGVAHYILVPLSTVLRSADSAILTQKVHMWDVLLAIRPFTKSLSCIVYLLACAIQHDCHRLLASRKVNQPNPPQAGPKKYFLPSSAAFDWVCCPHYTCEMVVYTCLAHIDCTWSSWLQALWVMCNLSVVADENMQWYNAMFARELQQRQATRGRRWWRVLPFVY